MELIDRWAALEIAMSYCPDDDGSCSKAGCDIREMLDELEALPTIEAKPIKRGQWIYGENEDGQDGIFCSECDHFVPWYYDYYDKTDDLINDNPRCPNCGARMDGGKNES